MTFSKLMLIGILGMVVSTIICYLADFALNTLKYKISKNSNSIFKEKVFDKLFYILCNRMYVFIISMVFSSIPIIYLVIRYGLSMLFIVLSIQLILQGFNFFGEYIIANKIHQFIVNSNEVIPKNYYKTYFSEWSDNLLLNELLISIICNIKTIIQIIKKEPLNIYF